MFFLRFGILKHVFRLLALVVLAGLLTCLVWPLGGAIVLAGGSLAGLIVLVAGAQCLRRRVRERLMERPTLTDAEFHRRFFSERGSRPENVAAVREIIDRHVGGVCGYRFWPDDRIDDVVHLLGVFPWRLRALVVDVVERFGITNADLVGTVWYRVGDIYATVDKATRRRLGSGPAGPGIGADGKPALGRPARELPPPVS